MSFPRFMFLTSHQPSAAPAALPAPTLPDLSMALVPIGGQLAKARRALTDVQIYQDM